MNKLDVSNIGLEDIKTSLKDYLKTKPEFNDWEFEGSNISYLVDMLSYVTYFTNTYNAFSLNESFLDTANLRSSIISHGKPHGYLPRSINTAEAIINFKLDIPKLEANGIYVPEVVTIPKTKIFTFKILDKVFYFTPDKTYVMYNTDNNLTYNNMILQEGNLLDYNTNISLNETIELPEKCDTDTLELYVDGKVWRYQENTVNLTKFSEAYFLRENSKGYFEIYFGDNKTSKKPSINSDINIKIKSTSGSEANAGNANVEIDYSDDLKINGIDYTDYVVLEVIQKPIGGKEKESKDEVRNGIYNKIITQDRAITTRDFKYIVEDKFYEIAGEAIAWDLNDEEASTDLEFGVISLSVKPIDYKQVPFLSQLQETEIAKELSLKYTISGIKVNFVNPLYIDVSHDIKVYIDNLKLNTTLSDITKQGDTVIENIYDDEITKFNTYLPISRLQSNIDALDNSIVSSSIQTMLNVRFYLESDVTFSFYEPLFNEIVPGTVECDFNNIYDDDNGDGTGTLKSDIGDLGTITYENGFVDLKIDGINITENELIRLKAKPKNNFIQVRFNHLLVDYDNNYEFISLK